MLLWDLGIEVTASYPYRECYKKKPHLWCGSSRTLDRGEISVLNSSQENKNQSMSTEGNLTQRFGYKSDNKGENSKAGVCRWKTRIESSNILGWGSQASTSLCAGEDTIAVCSSLLLRCHPASDGTLAILLPQKMLSLLPKSVRNWKSQVNLSFQPFAFQYSASDF